MVPPTKWLLNSIMFFVFWGFSTRYSGTSCDTTKHNVRDKNMSPSIKITPYFFPRSSSALFFFASISPRVHYTCQQTFICWSSSICDTNAVGRHTPTLTHSLELEAEEGSVNTFVLVCFGLVLVMCFAQDAGGSLASTRNLCWQR